MEANMLSGALVHLTAQEPNVLAEITARWAGNSEYLRLLDSEPTNRYSVKKLAEWMQKDQETDSPPTYGFSIRTLDEEKIVGFVGLVRDTSPHGDAFVGIGVGESEFWGKGYGTDAMKIILRYAFNELNLRKVTLDVFEYNPRAIRCYEKVGFVHEGRARKYLLREGRRWDLIYMGIMREEWRAGLD